MKSYQARKSLGFVCENLNDFENLLKIFCTILLRNANLPIILSHEYYIIRQTSIWTHTNQFESVTVSQISGSAEKLHSDRSVTEGYCHKTRSFFLCFRFDSDSFKNSNFDLTPSSSNTIPTFLLIFFSLYNLDLVIDYPKSSTKSL